MARRDFWQNCFGPETEDKTFHSDAELLAIETMEDSISPLDEDTTRVRQLITRFEACYHEADKEAEYLAGCIGAGREHCLSSEQ